MIEQIRFERPERGEKPVDLRQLSELTGIDIDKDEGAELTERLNELRAEIDANLPPEDEEKLQVTFGDGWPAFQFSTGDDKELKLRLLNILAKLNIHPYLDDPAPGSNLPPQSILTVDYWRDLEILKEALIFEYAAEKTRRHERWAKQEELRGLWEEDQRQIKAFKEWKEQRDRESAERQAKIKDILEREAEKARALQEEEAELSRRDEEFRKTSEEKTARRSERIRELIAQIPPLPETTIPERIEVQFGPQPTSFPYPSVPETRSRVKKAKVEKGIELDEPSAIDEELAKITADFETGDIEQLPTNEEKPLATIIWGLSTLYQPFRFRWKGEKLFDQIDERLIPDDEYMKIMMDAKDSSTVTGERAMRTAMGMHIGLLLSRLRRVAAKMPPGTSQHLEHAFSFGQEGLMRAIEDWDPSLSKFSTYAVATAEGYMRNGVREIMRIPVRLPAHVKDRVAQFRKAETALRHIIPERQISNIELALMLQQKGHLAVPSGRALDKLMRALHIDSEPVDVEEIDKMAPHDVSMRGESLHVVPDNIDSENVRNLVKKALLTLTPRQERVLRMRFGLGNTDKGSEGGEMTLEEVAEQFGVTGARIRQIETKALYRLSHPSRSRSLANKLGRETR